MGMSDGNSKTQDDFARHAQEQKRGLIREYIDFVKYNKKWWLVPIVSVLLIVGLVLILGSTAAAPLIYTLF